MKEGKHIPLIVGVLILIPVAILIDFAQFALDFLFGIGIIADPVLDAVAMIIFLIVHAACGVPMFSGKRSWSAWITFLIELVPVIDAIPAWTMYAVYITFSPILMETLRSIFSGV